MTEELGQIEKRTVESIEGKKKLFLIPLIFSSETAPLEYTILFSRYWSEVEEQISNLKSKLGSVQRIYHESISQGGTEGLSLIEKLSPSTYAIIKGDCDSGATLEAVEDKDLSEETIDWERCLMMGFIGANASKKVTELYMEASRKRFDYITNKIKETLKENEAGILFIRENHSVQFPSDIEVFLVSPPTLDAIGRWQRDYFAKLQKEEEEKEAGKPESN
ncbi:MAG: hypothetical protein NTV30_05940 [Chloroflexi bacterium]|nr:hypothetical protein [Chloroflexota bacterium]